jgi:hypothetical protein
MLLAVASRYATVIAGESEMPSYETFHKVSIRNCTMLILEVGFSKYAK